MFNIIVQCQVTSVIPVSWDLALRPEQNISLHFMKNLQTHLIGRLDLPRGEMSHEKSPTSDRSKKQMYDSKQYIWSQRTSISQHVNPWSRSGLIQFSCIQNGSLTTDKAYRRRGAITNVIKLDQTFGQSVYFDQPDKYSYQRLRQSLPPYTQKPTKFQVYTGLPMLRLLSAISLVKD